MTPTHSATPPIAAAGILAAARDGGQHTLFDAATREASAESDVGSRALPVIGEQHDIAYYGSVARGMLNDPGTTRMGFWSINPYVGCAFGCAYCYARDTHRYTLERSAAAHPSREALREDLARFAPWLAFERRIFVKENAAAVLRAALARSTVRSRLVGRGETVVIGTATDPYQPAERRFRITRSLLEVLAAERGLRLVIITKSPLVARDVDVLGRIARRSSITIHLSLITLDRTLARRLEPRAPTPESRVRALGRLADAGIRVGINVMPVLPGITDAPEALEALVRTVAERGASHVSAGALRLQAAARRRYLPFIETEFPALAARYRSTYAHQHEAGSRYREGLRAYMRGLCRRYGIGFGHDSAEDPAEGEDSPGPAEQLGLPL